MSSVEQIKDVLSERRNYFAQKYKVKNFAIFGSYARGEADENSDIDIMVEFSKSPGLEFVDLAEELEILLHQKVDLVSRNGIKTSYFESLTSDLVYV